MRERDQERATDRESENDRARARKQGQDRERERARERESESESERVCVLLGQSLQNCGQQHRLLGLLEDPEVDQENDVESLCVLV